MIGFWVAELSFFVVFRLLSATSHLFHVLLATKIAAHKTKTFPWPPSNQIANIKLKVKTTTTTHTMSGLEIAPLVMSVLPPAIEYFFAQDAAVSMDEDDNAVVHEPLRRSKAPRVLFHSHNEVSRRPMHPKAVQVTRLSLE